MNNLHYYTFLVQNMINARNKINEFKLNLMADKLPKDTEKLKISLGSLIEELFNSCEALCELYFSLDENDQILKNRIINLHKIEVEKLNQIREVGGEYNFIHKFLELKI